MDRRSLSPAAAKAHGTPLFTAKAPQQASRLRSWADEVSAGLDTGVRISLRVESFEVAESLGFRVVVQLHSLNDPTLVRDAAEVRHFFVPPPPPSSEYESAGAV